MKILMVDDHVMFLQGMRSLLGVLAPEHHVDVAADLGVALELARLTPYDLLLLDWHLAGPTRSPTGTSRSPSPTATATTRLRGCVTTAAPRASWCCRANTAAR